MDVLFYRETGEPTIRYSIHQLITRKKTITNVRTINQETVKRRLDVNIAQGEPILAHYRAKGLVHDIEGNQDINDVFKDIQKVLKNLK